jgi:hypothetical protein
MQTIARLLVAGTVALGRLLGSWVIACVVVGGLAVAASLISPDIWDVKSPSMPADGGPLEIAAAPGEIVNFRFAESDINAARSVAQASFVDADNTVTIPIGLHLDGLTLNGLLVAPHLLQNADGVLAGTIWGTLESDLGQTTSFERPFRIRLAPDANGNVEAYDSYTAAGNALIVFVLFALAAVTAVTYHVWSVSRSTTQSDLITERTDRERNS